MVSASFAVSVTQTCRSSSDPVLHLLFKDKPSSNSSNTVWRESIHRFCNSCLASVICFCFLSLTSLSFWMSLSLPMSSSFLMSLSFLMLLPLLFSVMLFFSMSLLFSKSSVSSVDPTSFPWWQSSVVRYSSSSGRMFRNKTGNR